MKRIILIVKSTTKQGQALYLKTLMRLSPVGGLQTSDDLTATR
jgi:hypothetical protein